MEYVSGIGKEASGMEGIACVLSHGRIETLKLPPVAPVGLIARPVPELLSRAEAHRKGPHE